MWGEDVSNSWNGHKVLTVGATGAGKSTCLGSLAYCIQSDPDLLFEHNPDNMIGYQTFMHNWVMRIERKQFPNVTNPSTYIEIDAAIGLDHDDMLPLTFVEASGEDLSQWDVLQHPVGTLPEVNFHKKIAQAILDMSVLVLMHPANVTGITRWDGYFCQLLKLVRTMRGRENMCYPIPHLLILSKWDDRPDGMDQETFVKQRLPSTYGQLRDDRWVSDFTCFNFSVGEVGEGKGELVIEKFDPKDSIKIISWFLKTL